MREVTGLWDRLRGRSARVGPAALFPAHSQSKDHPLFSQLMCHQASIRINLSNSETCSCAEYPASILAPLLDFSRSPQ